MFTDWEVPGVIERLEGLREMVELEVVPLPVLFTVAVAVPQFVVSRMEQIDIVAEPLFPVLVSVSVEPFMFARTEDGLELLET